MPQLDIDTFDPMILDLLLGYNVSYYYLFTQGGPEIIFFLALLLSSCIKKKW